MWTRWVNSARSSIRLSSGVAAAAPERWDILASVCLERLPVVSPLLDEMQTKYKSFLEATESSGSFKSDHEIRHEKDVEFLKKLKNESADLSSDAINKITAQDFEDASLEEFTKFKPAPTETEADKLNDITSLERKLRSHLVLLVEQKLGDEAKFLLPQGLHRNGETLRQTAERVLKETCGEDVNAKFFGNVPCGYYRYKWKSSNNTVGVKVFFYYAKYMSGQVTKDANYKWLTRNELESILPQNYHSSVASFLVDETP